VRGSVLIVDDDDQITELLKVILSRAHECEVATDAATALARVSAGGIDLMLVDIGLPGGSGLELAREIIESSHDVAVVMVTGESDPAVAAAAVQLGAYGYVIKPFTVNEILIAADNALHRRRLEAENRAMVAKLRDMDDAKDALMAAVSHDLRSPLSGIVGFADFLKARLDQLPPDKTRDILGDIADAGRRVTRMIQDLLDRDRLSRGVVSRSPTDVRKIVEAVADHVDLADHPLHVECPSLKAVLDGPMVERIVENLVANAVKHTPAGTDIWIQVREVRDGLEIVVCDAGAGIADELKPVILERYRRGATAATGSGVGLSLVDRFASLQGGGVAVEDRPGGGSAFRVFLPTSDADVA
jgi:signal transduction histidine kinase